MASPWRLWGMEVIFTSDAVYPAAVFSRAKQVKMQHGYTPHHEFTIITIILGVQHRRFSFVLSAYQTWGTGLVRGHITCIITNISLCCLRTQIQGFHIPSNNVSLFRIWPITIFFLLLFVNNGQKTKSTVNQWVLKNEIFCETMLDKTLFLHFLDNNVTHFSLSRDLK